MSSRRKIAVIGLGYVGLPVAVAFAREGFAVVGFDIDTSRISDLESGQDHLREKWKAGRSPGHPLAEIYERRGRSPRLRFLHRDGAHPNRRRAAARSSGDVQSLAPSGCRAQEGRYRRL